MFKTLQNLFRPRSPEEDMAKELFEARKALLEAFSGQEYATAMVEYHQTRIKRLQASLQEVPHDHTTRSRPAGSGGDALRGADRQDHAV